MSGFEASAINQRELHELTWEAERFLFREADLLDARRYEEWLDTLHEDLVYFVPILRNIPHNELEQREATREGEDISWFEEDKWTLGKRIEQIRTGVHWAEEPMSRVVHIVSNVYVTSVGEVDGEREIGVSSRILVRQNRNQYENITLIGRRQDVLRESADTWTLRRREVRLTENVLSAKMLTTFL